MSGLTDFQIRQRIGCLTASRMRDARAMLKKGGESESRFAYKVELVTERLTGLATTRYVNAAMERGSMLEDAAKEAYEVATGDVLGPPDFYPHPSIEFCGATPDSVTRDRLHEFKVPLPTTYVKWMIGNEIPPEHFDQMILQQACCKIFRTTFVAYCPEMPDGLQLFIREFSANAEQLTQCEHDARSFLDEVAALYHQLGGE